MYEGKRIRKGWKQGKMIKHNCCKELNFEWFSIGSSCGDILICKICKRRFREEGNENQ